MGIIMSKKSMFHKSAFHMSRVAQTVRAMAALAGMAGSAGLALAQTPTAVPPTFPQSPPMATSSAGVKPNIILSVDNSTSMYPPNIGSNFQDATCTPGTSTVTVGTTTYTLGGKCVADGHGGGNEYRIQALQDALMTAFSDPTVVGTPGNEKFRLAYQSMWADAGFGPKRGFKSTTGDYDNAMQLFDAAGQDRFFKWVASLTNRAGSATPSQWMFAYAGEYLKGRWLSNGPTSGTLVINGVTTPSAWDTFTSFTDTHPEYSPWNQTPGTADPAPLACRRAYHIFMTDGMWNSNFTEMAPPVPLLTGDTTATGNYLNSPKTLPATLAGGSTAYDPTLYPIYKNATCTANSTSYTSPCGSTMADYAFYYWVNDLQPSIANNLDTSMAAPITANATYTSGTKTATYPPDWNPQNDPATWQHMQTFAIGFGTSNLQGAGQIQAPGTATQPHSVTFDELYGTSSGSFFAKYATGAQAWPATGGNAPGNLEDLVHAAYVSRGKFYAATSAEALTNAFKDILVNAVNQSAPGGVASAAASGARLTGGTLGYVAAYTYDATQANQFNPTTESWGIMPATAAGNITGTIDGWSGTLQAYKTNENGIIPPSLWSATIPATRQIFSANRNNAGIPFVWGGTGGFTSSDAPAPFDNNALTVTRQNPLGDIVNSQVVYVGSATSRASLDVNYSNFATAINSRKGIVYVGANDGMLHGFDGGKGNADSGPGTGKEVFAYVPRGLLTGLSNFYNVSSFAHAYTVDGNPFAGDAQLAHPGIGTGNPDNWGTVLVSGLGAGGKGYFVLDVTTPDNLQESAVSTLSQAVLIDATDVSPDHSPLRNQTITNGDGAGSPVLDVIGNQFSPPVMEMYTVNQSSQIVKLNSGEWAVIMGNGYGSANGKPALLLQSLSQGGAYLNLYSIGVPCVGGTANDCIAIGNGLGAPRAIDVDGNGTVDIVYAGDLMGNLWKFDISSANRGDWKVAYEGQPFFKAVGPTGVSQPITSAPAVVPSMNGGFMVAFGTGKNLVEADQNDTNLNTVYGLYDNQKMTASTSVVGGKVVSLITLGDPAPLPSGCLAGAGAARYAVASHGCLNLQNDTSGGQQGAVWYAAGSQTPAGSAEINGVDAWGWYFDIPEDPATVMNETGEITTNAAKVLANPVVQDNNNLMFYSDNVMSSTVTNGPSNGVESCSASASINGLIRTVNYVDAATGNYPDNSLSFMGEHFDPSKGNRFRQVAGSAHWLANGTNSQGGVEAIGAAITIPPIVAGQRAGWRIGR